MNRHLAKEFRVLLLPWSVALVIAIILPVANFLLSLHIVEGGTFINFVLGVASFAFFGCLLAVAALPFGVEFLHKTFPLLLSQPVSRTQIWKDKLIAGSVAVVIPLGVLALVQCAAQSAADFILRSRGGEVSGLSSLWGLVLSALALLLPTLGSVGYWTLLARSTLGGMVFTAFSQLLAFGLLAFIGEKIDIDFRGNAQVPLSIIMGVLYGGGFLLISWRKFVRLELSHSSLADSGGAKSLTARPSRLAWLRCRPTSSLLNLVRKEIQLQRPLFIIATLLLVLWIITYVWLLLPHTSTNFPEIVFALTIGFYIPLISTLAGTVSFGEEKNLAIVGWHLTFPVSIWRQWAVKLAIGFGAWLLLGLLLPFCLTRVGVSFWGRRSYGEFEVVGWLGVSLFMSGVFALSFWAMTLFSNTVRAIIASLVAVLALCGAASLAYWLLVQFAFPHPLVRTLQVYDTHWGDSVGWVLLGASTIVLAFVQSLVQFRRLQASPRTVIKYSGALMLFVFVGTACYFLLLPFTQFTPAIYLLLFLLLLIIIRAKLHPSQSERFHRLNELSRQSQLPSVSP
jgi:hypothetical protein